MQEWNDRRLLGRTIKADMAMQFQQAKPTVDRKIGVREEKYMNEQYKWKI